MTFIPPAFQTLRVNTLNLDAKLSTVLGRYLIVDKTPLPAAAAKALNVQSPLEVLIARTNIVLQCKTDRISQRDVFSKLVSELREVLKEGDEAKMKQATMFLLGALIHRYFRIQKEYEDWTTSFYKPNPNSCTLFNALRIALHFEVPPPADFKTKDLMSLDVTTIVHSLEVFQANMLVEDKFKTPRYKAYPHFAQDPHFLKYLQEMIDAHKVRGKIILNQFKAIKFVQSLADKLETDRRQIEEEVQKWSKKLIEDHEDFSELDQQTIEEHIKENIKSTAVSEKILDLLYTPHIIDNLASMDHYSFIERMNSCYTDIARYTLFGGYSLLLLSEGTSEELKACINKCLGSDTKQNEITESDMFDGIRFLEQLIEQEPDIVLNCDVFGGKERLDTEIAQRKLALTKSIKAKDTDKASEPNTFSLV